MLMNILYRFRLEIHGPTPLFPRNPLIFKGHGLFIKSYLKSEIHHMFVLELGSKDWQKTITHS